MSNMSGDQSQAAIGGNMDLLLALSLEVPISCHKLVMEECRCAAQSVVFHTGLHEQRTEDRTNCFAKLFLIADLTERCKAKKWQVPVSWGIWVMRRAITTTEGYT